MRKALVEASQYAHGVMIDIGCGLRPYENIFREKITSYIGLDYPMALDKARVEIVADALELPLADGSVDTTLATEVMEHLSDPDKFLSQIARVSRPSGILILSIPFMEPLHEEPRDYFRFTPYSLSLLMARHGFEVKQILPKGGWWSVVLSSFVSQVVYDWANPVKESDGSRRDGVGMFVALPICAAVQWLGYMLDRVFRSSRYTLGYIAIGRLSEPDTSATDLEPVAVNVDARQTADSELLTLATNS
jgi:SAM-dependent methyltransferase